MFRRRRGGDDATDAEDEQRTEAAAEDREGAAPLPTPGPQGPWDEQDAPADDVPRLDLGSMRVPVSPATEVRVEIGDGGQVVAATFVTGESSAQVNVFAAPKTAGIWNEVRAELLASLVESGGSAEEVDGPFGPEVQARLAPAEGGGPQSARFVGVDGPRWFLRGVFTGPAATDPAQAAALEQTLRQVVVVRGKDAMAPRDGLPLRLPKEAVAAADGQPEDGRPEGPPAETEPTVEEFRPFERGPEINELR